MPSHNSQCFLIINLSYYNLFLLSFRTSDIFLLVKSVSTYSQTPFCFFGCDIFTNTAILKILIKMCRFYTLYSWPVVCSRVNYFLVWSSELCLPMPWQPASYILIKNLLIENNYFVPVTNKQIYSWCFLLWNIFYRYFKYFAIWFFLSTHLD